ENNACSNRFQFRDWEALSLEQRCWAFYVELLAPSLF
ncbi:MAG: hypothetical protein RLZ61_2125, partial [Planctomycetota bacterium]